PDVAFGVQTLRLLIVDDPVGLKRGVSVVDLDIANCGNAIVGIVVVDLVCLNEHLLLPGLFAFNGNRGFFRRRRTRRKCQFLCGHGARPKKSAAGGRAKDGNNVGAAARGRRRGGASANDPRHQPSSWYSNAMNPVTPPTSTGNHAAATGCIS